MTQVAVIGAGSWGTSVSWLLGGKGQSVTMWAREPEITAAVNAHHANPLYMKDVVLPESVRATSDIEEALRGAEAVVMVTPSMGVRSTAQAMAPHLGADVPVVILSKGVEEGSLMLMTEVLEDVLGNRDRLAGLSGPNHAEEVGKGIPSATVVAAHREEVGRFFQDLFMTRFFRVYTNPDVVGVELCGASKNVVAVGAGVCDGLGYGDNTKATLMTRGLAEMSRLGRAMGANPLTYSGLAGIGDLIATCTSKNSRNRGLGEFIGRGGTLEGWRAQTNMVAEGAYACIAVKALGERTGVDLPVTSQVHAVLYEGVPVSAGEEALLGRAARDELHGMELVED